MHVETRIAEPTTPIDENGQALPHLGPDDLEVLDEGSGDGAFDGVPDNQRILWVLDQLHKQAEEIRYYASRAEQLQDTISRLRELAERADARDAERHREQIRITSLSTRSNAGEWGKWLRNDVSRPLFALVTFVGGAIFAVVAKRTGIAPEWLIDLVKIVTGVH